ncbi:putative rna polymerase ii mediator complex component [Diaporthe ampelina]|uniref:Putative rna polymerase ii mediator complex component n=1 Tax=Diaporthe ampelina TaxID=1214573 RepID=A0A0G2FT02_9PEZI|nr:putative rna polymerase ii mediator complex component [Diaporthe ampelina]
MPAAKEIGRPLDMWDPSVLLSFAPTSSPVCGDLNHAPASVGLELDPPSALLPGTPAKQLSPAWFMSPESWKIEHGVPHYRDPMPASPYSRIALKAFLTTGQGWLSDWISTGGTAFIHKQLYSFRLPRPVQDAYTAVALYLLRTDENEDMVHRTIQDRSAQLLRDEEKHKASSSLDPFGHLARVHALLAYQIICLLDGDMRLRALAEERIPTMMAWLDQMLESVSFASQLTPSGTAPAGAMAAARGLGLGIVDVMDASPGGASTPAAATTSAGRAYSLNPGSHEEVLWHAWIFTESARRTLLFAQGLHTVYDVMLKGWTICAGAPRITTASDVWDAPTSYAWGKLCVERNVRLSTPHEVENFLTEARPEDVDDFTKSLLGVMFGKAKMDRWMDAKT